MSEKSFGETTILTRDNIAAILALIGKEEATTKSPTAIVMLGKLKDTMKLTFDKLQQRGDEFCMLRFGGTISMDDAYIEYAKIPKIPGTTKAFAIAQFLSSIQQHARNNHVELLHTEEGPENFEFVASVRDY